MHYPGIFILFVVVVLSFGMAATHAPPPPTDPHTPIVRGVRDKRWW